MFRNSQQHLWTSTSCRADRLQPYGRIIIATIQSTRFIVLTSCRSKAPNISARNYYEILGVERTATAKEIKKAFYKLSKEYHPDANTADKSLHEKFVKINEAFGTLSKQSTRSTYDQRQSPTFRPSNQSSAPPRQRAGSPYDWSNSNFGSRGADQRRSTTANESDWGTPHYDKTFYDLLRRRMREDRERARSSSTNPTATTGLVNAYFAPLSLISFLIGFGLLIHTFKGRMLKFEEPTYVTDPRTRNYHAYREWQRLSSLKDAESMPMRERTKPRVVDDET